METTDKNKIYPPGITNYMLLCILAFLYLYLGLLVIPLLTIMGQFFSFIHPGNGGSVMGVSETLICLIRYIIWDILVG